MSSTNTHPKPPVPECASSQVGPCASCQHPTHRYGYGGSPLCVLCQARLEEWRASQGKGSGIRA